MLHEGNHSSIQVFKTLNLMKKCLVLFQNYLDYETFVKIVEIHKNQPTWKMYFEKIKKKLCSFSWLKKVNVMSKKETL